VPVAVRRRRLLVNFEDPVAQRLARLIAQEQPHPTLGEREDMLRLRSYVMRDPKHTWRVCRACDTPFDTTEYPDQILCDPCIRGSYAHA